MVNSKATTEVNDGVKTLTIDAHFVMGSYKRKDGTEVSTVNLKLIKPFQGEDLEEVELKAKWDKRDENTGRVIQVDRVYGLMEYYAGKALKTVPEVPVKVTVTPERYKSKKTGNWVTVAAIYADPTFPELEDEKSARMVVKDVREDNTFGFLAGKALGITITPKEMPGDDDVGDVGLMD